MAAADLRALDIVRIGRLREVRGAALVGCHSDGSYVGAKVEKEGVQAGTQADTGGGVGYEG